MAIPAVLKSLCESGSVPVGTIISLMGNNAPIGYLKCDGTTYNIEDYQDLADYFESEFGSKNKFGGDGTTTFKVPDLQGEFLRGSGNNSHTDQGSGANVGIHQDGTISTSAEANYNSLYLGQYPIVPNNNADKIIASGALRWVGTNDSTSSDSRGMKYTSRPTNTSVLYCIKY